MADKSTGPGKQLFTAISQIFGKCDIENLPDCEPEAFNSVVLCRESCDPEKWRIIACGREITGPYNEFGVRESRGSGRKCTLGGSMKSWTRRNYNGKNNVPDFTVPLYTEKGLERKLNQQGCDMKKKLYAVARYFEDGTNEVKAFVGGIRSAVATDPSVDDDNAVSEIEATIFVDGPVEYFDNIVFPLVDDGGAC